MDQHQNNEGGSPVVTPAPQETTTNTPVHTDNSTLMGILSYLGPLVFIPLITEKENAFVRFHVRQGLVLFVIEAALWVLGSMLFIHFLWPLVSIINLACLILSIIGILNVINKKQVALPLVGQFADKFKV